MTRHFPRHHHKHALLMLLHGHPPTLDPISIKKLNTEKKKKEDQPQQVIITIPSSRISRKKSRRYFSECYYGSFFLLKGEK